MSVSPHLHLGAEALSHQVKRGVTPIDKPERRKKGPKGLACTRMERKPYAIPRVCERCGTAFRATGTSQRFCGATCRNAAALISRLCVHCGREFRREGWSKQKFCSHSCSVIANGPPALKTYSPRRCRVCDEKFAPRSSGQRYCSRKCRLKVKSTSGTLRNQMQWGVKAKGEIACRCCGTKAVHLHHIVPRSKTKLGRWEVHANGLPLCFTCHSGWHSRTVTISHQLLTDDEFRFAVTHGGALWVERNYPDETLVAFHRLDELVNRRVVNPDRPESFDERVERLLEIGRAA